MKSEIEEFWSLLNSEDLQEQEVAYQKWKEFLSGYQQHFDEVKKYMSKSFYKLYEKINLHDFQFMGVDCNHKEFRKTEIKILLYDYHKEYGKDFYLELVYKNVINYSVVVEKTEFEMFWSRDIFEITENGLLKHRVMCTDGTKIEIVSKKVSLSKIKI